MSSRYVRSNKAQEIIGVSYLTLKKWASEGSIEFIVTPGGKRMYNVNKFLSDRGIENTDKKQKICYCRVSSTGQKNDLERQVEAMRKQFPNHKIITDIASGINFKRKGLLYILEQSQRRNVTEVVIAYRDRLCRFAFELFEWFFQSNEVKLVVLNQNMESSQNAELADDLLSIIHVFNCRMQGKRKYKNQDKIKEEK